jgi:plastocyanin
MSKTMFIALIMILSIMPCVYVMGVDLNGEALGMGAIFGSVTVDGKSDLKGFNLQEAVIFIQGPSLALQEISTKNVDEAAAVIDQKSKTYLPRVVAVTAGSPVEFRNSDLELHNVHATCKKNPPFNIAMVRGIKPQRRVFAKPEVVKLSCNVHRDMLAYVVVLENPYFATPNDSGVYEIAGIPPGNYTVTLWHEKFEETKKEVTVESGKKVEVNFALESAKAIRRR